MMDEARLAELEALCASWGAWDEVTAFNAMTELIAALREARAEVTHLEARLKKWQEMAVQAASEALTATEAKP